MLSSQKQDPTTENRINDAVELRAAECASALARSSISCYQQSLKQGNKKK